jgi:hypothetical protein
MKRWIMNPYPPTHPHLRRAFDDGVRAARRRVGGPSRADAPDTKEEALAWLNGFVQARMHRAQAGRPPSPPRAGRSARPRLGRERT